MKSPSLFLALFCLVAVPASTADLPQIQKTGKLRVVVWSANLPELYAARGGPDAGMEAEILQGFATLHRLKLALVPVDAIEARIPALLEDRGDLVAGGLVDTPARRRQVDFTSELFPIRHVVVNHRSRPRIETVAALREVKVGTVKGSSWADEVARLAVPAKNVDASFASADDLLSGLRAGKVDAVVMSAVWALVEGRKDSALQLGAFVGEPTSVGFAVRKDQPQLRAALDDYIANVRRTPTWSRLVVKYFGEDGLRILKASR